MPIPTPQERPDLYDSYDLPAHDFKPSTAYLEATMPTWMSNAIKERAREHQAAADGTAQSSVGAVQMLQVEPVIALVQQWQLEKPVAVVSVQTNHAGGVDALRTAEIKALRNLANDLEHNRIQPGHLIVNVLAKS